MKGCLRLNGKSLAMLIGNLDAEEPGSENVKPTRVDGYSDDICDTIPNSHSKVITTCSPLSANNRPH
jgi:hypothetical protein